MSQRYSLEDLWTASEAQIQQILRYFGQPIYGDPRDRLNAIILSFNHNLLLPEDRPYVASPNFNELFLSTSSIQALKTILDRTPIPIVTSIPSQITESFAPYQMNDLLYLCGKGTYNIREQLKAIGGLWDPNVKCWRFPSGSREALLNLISIPLSIPSVPQVPPEIPGELGVYQMGGQVLVCGRRTYDLQDQLRAIGGTFDRIIGCWTFPPNRSREVLNLMWQLQQAELRKAQEAQQLREAQLKARQEALLKRQEETQRKAQEEMSRLSRLQMPETEAQYTPVTSRLSPGVSSEIKNQALIQEAKQLRDQWGSQIQQVKWLPGGRGYKEAILTYTGEVKPPNIALALAVDEWNPFNFGFSVDRVDYKTYRVRVFTD